MSSKHIFEILMRENSAMLLTYIRSVVGSASAVDDIFQETMITAWKKLGDFDVSKSFGPWLRGIAKNHALNHFRQSSKDMLVCNEDIFSYLDTQFQHIEQQDGDSWKDKVSALHRCIENLPDIYKQSVHLTYLHDMKTSQIHSLNEIPKETLKKRIQRARKQLFVCLKEQGILRASQEVLV